MIHSVSTVDQRLTEEPYRFDFFQAVRVLRWLAHQTAVADQATQRPIGQDYLPRDELVRFQAVASLSFPQATIAQLERDSPRARARMTVAFFGLTGPTGALPQHYTQLVVDRTRHKDFALRNYCDLFNHRLTSLFYRAGIKYRPPLVLEESVLSTQPGPDPITHALLCLVGLGTEGLPHRQSAEDQVFVYYAGHCAHYPRNALALECLLSDYFHVPVRVCQFQGRWLYLERDDQTKLAAPAFRRKANNTLGHTAVAGERVWSVQSKFRVRIGPVGYTQFLALSPLGKTLRPLVDIVRFYAGAEFDFDVQPVLKRDEVPPCRLDSSLPHGPHLGWNSWIFSQPFPRDADDAAFDAEVIESLFLKTS